MATRRSWGWAVAVVVIAAAMLALVALITREGPDRSVTGTITRREGRRLCVADQGGKIVCADADAPESLVGFAVGECVRLRYSAQHLVITLVRAGGRCGP